MSFDRRESILSPTGSEIAFCRDGPRNLAPRGIVQINHGLAEHAARYGGFAGFLAERGFAVYAHDHRGHGRTVAPDASLGSFGADGGDAVIADVAAMHDHIARAHPGLPVIVFGHSMGAIIALNFVLRHPDRIAGAAIWNGNFSAGALGHAARALLAWERFRLGSDVPSRILPRLTFESWARRESDGRTPFDWLSRDRREVDAYVADPLCGWSPSVGMWRAVFELIARGADDRGFSRIRKDLPFNLVGGGRDPATDGGKAVEALGARLRAMGFSNLVSTIYPGNRHESLNELNRDLIMEAFADWAGRVVAQ